MPSIHITNIPEGTFAVLRQRATAAHLPLEEYVRDMLIAEVARPTLDEVLDRVRDHTGGSLPLPVAARAVRSDRARR